MKKSPFKVPTGGPERFLCAQKAGPLQKRTTNPLNRKWKKRWFVLDGLNLYYFAGKHDEEPRGIIELEGLQVRYATDVVKDKHCFELFVPVEKAEALGAGLGIRVFKTDPSGEGICCHAEAASLRLSAENDVDRASWVSLLQQAISGDPYYEEIVARKKVAKYRDAAAASVPGTQ